MSLEVYLLQFSDAQRFPASSVLAREGAGCGSVGDVPGAWLASAPLPFPSPGDLRHWQADSLPLSHQGSPIFVIFKKDYCSMLGQKTYFYRFLLHCPGQLAMDRKTAQFPISSPKESGAGPGNAPPPMRTRRQG